MAGKPVDSAADLLALWPDVPATSVARAQAVLDDARIAASECAHRQTTARSCSISEMTSRLGLMTAQLLSALDIADKHSNSSTAPGGYGHRACRGRDLCCARR